MKKKADTAADATPQNAVEAAPEASAAAAQAAPAAEESSGSVFARLRQSLGKTRAALADSLSSLILGRKSIDESLLEDIETQLLTADMGLAATEHIISALTRKLDRRQLASPEALLDSLKDELTQLLTPCEQPLPVRATEGPFVILVVGVNGAGKTTTIGKLGAIARREGFKVMFAACDTFRAAAIEQLNVWGGRIGARVMSRPTGADASGLAFDAIREAKEDGTDILFIDTAGRLQNKQYLMDELDKIVRVIKKQDEAAPHAVLLVLDATTGQNAMAQAEIFTKVAGVTGLIMTKLDGTARGGILVAIAEKFRIPVHAIGVGESIEDLQPFDAEGFARAIAGLEET